MREPRILGNCLTTPLGFGRRGRLRGLRRWIAFEWERVLPGPAPCSHGRFEPEPFGCSELPVERPKRRAAVGGAAKFSKSCRVDWRVHLRSPSPRNFHGPFRQFRRLPPALDCRGVFEVSGMSQARPCPLGGLFDSAPRTGLASTYRHTSNRCSSGPLESCGSGPGKDAAPRTIVSRVPTPGMSDAQAAT